MYFFKKTRWLFVIAFWLIITTLFSSCSSYKQHYRSQKNDYSQCWCIDPWDGGAEWCCPGKEPGYMGPYRYKANF